MSNHKITFKLLFDMLPKKLDKRTQINKIAEVWLLLKFFAMQQKSSLVVYKQLDLALILGLNQKRLNKYLHILEEMQVIGFKSDNRPSGLITKNGSIHMIAQTFFSIQNFNRDHIVELPQYLIENINDLVNRKKTHAAIRQTKNKTSQSEKNKIEPKMLEPPVQIELPKIVKEPSNDDLVIDFISTLTSFPKVEYNPDRIDLCLSHPNVLRFARKVDSHNPQNWDNCSKIKNFLYTKKDHKDVSSIET